VFHGIRAKQKKIAAKPISVAPAKCWDRNGEDHAERPETEEEAREVGHVCKPFDKEDSHLGAKSYEAVRRGRTIWGV